MYVKEMEQQGAWTLWKIVLQKMITWSNTLKADLSMKPEETEPLVRLQA